MDNSVNLYVMLGIIAMSIAPVENALHAINELRKYEGQKQNAAERKRIRSEEERLQEEKEKIRAANELAKRHDARSNGSQEA